MNMRMSIQITFPHNRTLVLSSNTNRIIQYPFIPPADPFSQSRVTSLVTSYTEAPSYLRVEGDVAQLLSSVGLVVVEGRRAGNSGGVIAVHKTSRVLRHTPTIHLKRKDVPALSAKVERNGYGGGGCKAWLSVA